MLIECHRNTLIAWTAEQGGGRKEALADGILSVLYFQAYQQSSNTSAELFVSFELNCSTRQHGYSTNNGKKKRIIHVILINLQIKLNFSMLSFVIGEGET